MVSDYQALVTLQDLIHSKYSVTGKKTGELCKVYSSLVHEKYKDECIETNIQLDIDFMFKNLSNENKIFSMENLIDYLKNDLRIEVLVKKGLEGLDSDEEE